MDTSVKYPNLLIAVLLLLTGLLDPMTIRAEEILVFAAASTTDALVEVSQAYEQISTDTIVFSFASSSTLARQIEHGAMADIYIAANIKWMDYLEKQNLLLTMSRTSLLTNQLVLIAPANSDIDQLNIRRGFPIMDILKDNYLVMGNPDHVPAGIYGMQALKSLGVWDMVQGHIARSANVRASLALVASGEAPLGIVYITDALIADDVKIVGVFPKGTHDPIIYPAARTKVSDGNVAVLNFYQYLRSEYAGNIFKKYGFKLLK